MAAGVPQPETIIVNGSADLAKAVRFPAFLKRPVSTASAGVRCVDSSAALADAAQVLGLGETELLLQTAVEGPLVMVQAVAQRGRLIAYHANVRAREGIGGGASLKESIVVPGLRPIAAQLIAALDWHGALSMDEILGPNGPVVIDINPRIVEPGNAVAAGVDLVGAMLALTSVGNAEEQPDGRAGVRTHQALLAILGAAKETGRRRAILREAWSAFSARGPYEGSIEELTPMRHDPLAAAPTAIALVATLIHPPVWRRFHAGAVAPYALTPQAWTQILAAAA